MSRSRYSRRSILAGAAAGIGSTMLPLPGFGSTISRDVRAKNIIFCVSDGMSAGTPSMADQLLQMVHGQRSYWYELMHDGEVRYGWMDTRSLNSLVTDSAAAATSWGSGSLVMNGAINTLPGVGELTPLYDILGRDGMRRGLVTTATITHATPSGFAATVKTRSAEPEIAEQYRTRGVEVLMGGGDKFFSPTERDDKKDLYALYAQDGYAVCKTKKELAADRGSEKVLGIFSRGYIPYSVDHKNSAELQAECPTLTEMSKAAIDRLRHNSKGFVLQIEGARIDHGAHANDLAALVYDQIEFESAVKAAMDFARQDGETLVIVTTDHGNANPGITNEAEYGDGNGLLKLEQMTASYDVLMPVLKKAESASDVQDIVQKYLNIKLSEAQAQAVFDSGKGKSPLAPFGNYTSATSCLAMALGSHTGVGFTSGGHTSDWVQIMAYGPGADMFGGFVRNHTLFDKMLALRGLKFSNPKITLEEAKKSMTKSAQAELVAATEEHWL